MDNSRMDSVHSEREVRKPRPDESTDRVAVSLNKQGREERWDRSGRTIFVVDAHRDGQRFIVRADEGFN